MLFFRIIEIAYFRTDEAGAIEERREAPLLMLKPLLLTAAALIVVGLGSGWLVDDIIRLTLPLAF